ncbi:hypothetical protein CSUI_005692, partial [Cystoisospora suis]
AIFKRHRQTYVSTTGLKRRSWRFSSDALACLSLSFVLLALLSSWASLFLCCHLCLFSFVVSPLLFCSSCVSGHIILQRNRRAWRDQR